MALLVEELKAANHVSGVDQGANKKSTGRLLVHHALLVEKLEAGDVSGVEKGANEEITCTLCPSCGRKLWLQTMLVA